MTQRLEGKVNYLHDADGAGRRGPTWPSSRPRRSTTRSGPTSTARSSAAGASPRSGRLRVRRLTRALTLELAPLRINVNNLAPGMVLTPFNQAAIDDPQLLEEQVQSIPFKRAGATYVMDGGLMRNLGQGA